jgi:hypothetical protein
MVFVLATIRPRSGITAAPQKTARDTLYLVFPVRRYARLQGFQHLG